MKLLHSVGTSVVCYIFGGEMYKTLDVSCYITYTHDSFIALNKVQTQSFAIFD